MASDSGMQPPAAESSDGDQCADCKKRISSEIYESNLAGYATNRLSVRADSEEEADKYYKINAAVFQTNDKCDNVCGDGGGVFFAAGGNSSDFCTVLSVSRAATLKRALKFAGLKPVSRCNYTGEAHHWKMNKNKAKYGRT